MKNLGQVKNSKDIVTKKYTDDGLNKKADSEHRHDNATSVMDGFMSSSNFSKLLGIQENATRVIVDNDFDENSTNALENKKITNKFNQIDDNLDLIDDSTIRQPLAPNSEGIIDLNDTILDMKPPKVQLTNDLKTRMIRRYYRDKNYPVAVFGFNNLPNEIMYKSTLNMDILLDNELIPSNQDYTIRQTLVSSISGVARVFERFYNNLYSTPNDGTWSNWVEITSFNIITEDNKSLTIEKNYLDKSLKILHDDFLSNDVNTIGYAGGSTVQLYEGQQFSLPYLKVNKQGHIINSGLQYYNLNSNHKVEQDPVVDDNSNYRILLSNSNNDTKETAIVKKNLDLYYNPSTKTLTVDNIDGNSSTATKWENAININGMSIDGSTNITNFGICTTAGSVKEKTVSCPGFELVDGAEITVKFNNINSASQPTLNVNSTGPKVIMYNNTSINVGSQLQNRTYIFRYISSYYEFYELVGELNTKAKLIIDSSNTSTSNTETALTNGNVYLNIIEDSKVMSSHKISGSGATTVTTDASGNIIVNSNDTKYTHPSYTARSSGLYKVTVDSTGHVSAATAVAKSDITALGIPASDTNTHYASKNVVGSSTATSNTTSALTNGNVYLNSVENGAVTSAHKISGSGATTVTTDKSGNIIVNSNDTKYNAATTSANGLMTSSMVTKLNGISDSADSVSISRNLTSGTKVGTITINGTGTDLYAPTNTDTNVTQTNTTANANYRLLLSYNANDTSGQYNSRKSSKFLANPSTGIFTATGGAKFDGLINSSIGTLVGQILYADQEAVSITIDNLWNYSTLLVTYHAVKNITSNTGYLFSTLLPIKWINSGNQYNMPIGFYDGVYNYMSFKKDSNNDNTLIISSSDLTNALNSYTTMHFYSLL